MMHFARDRFGRKRKGNSGGGAAVDKKNKHNNNNNTSNVAADRQYNFAVYVPTKRREAPKSKKSMTTIRLPPPNTAITTSPTKVPKLSTLIESTNFDSVLDKPFDKWNDIEVVISNFEPEWTHRQRGCIILHLIRFLELKVLMDEYVGNQLLSPSPLIQRAWRALILETQLYKRVTCTIQNFHGRTRRMIHHSSVLSQYGGSGSSIVHHQQQKDFEDERFRRTQSLFQCCYGEQMPVSMNEIDSSDLSLGDASALTDLGQYASNMKNSENKSYSNTANNSKSPQKNILEVPADHSGDVDGINGTSAIPPAKPNRTRTSSSGIVDMIPKLSSRTPSLPDIVERQRQHFEQFKLQAQSPFACFTLVHDSMFGTGTGSTNLDDHITEVTPDDDNSRDGIENMMEGVEVIDVP